ncbi:MAG: biotin--[acetyl-CoA-carboxylase] ligase [Scytonematopsis contorta HA4267-MV1]|nr:biotin--[acetyl-CoA-carboxylase] ligase [Scytonematopsis contorta HA4267-MV1]
MGLNQQQIQKVLNKELNNTCIPFSLHIFNSVSSTNQTLWELQTQGAKAGTVVIATQQTAGRGQWGRQWVSCDGGLYLSLLISPQLEAVFSYQLTLASAWGIANELRLRGVPIEIKWPNDLVINGRKLGGILTETKVQKGLINQAVIGVGINWSNYVPETGINLQAWQIDNHTEYFDTLEDLTAAVLLGIDSGMKCLFQEGTNILLSRYLGLLSNMGEQVEINHGLGTIVGVTPSGELRVSMEPSSTNVTKGLEIFLKPGRISLGYRKSPE